MDANRNIVALGTGDNPQTVSVLLDTGSFEMWVNPNCSAANVQDYCEAFGHYDPKMSPTAKSLNTNFGIQYGQGSASGVYYKDDVYLSGKSCVPLHEVKGLGHKLLTEQQVPR